MKIFKKPFCKHTSVPLKFVQNLTAEVFGHPTSIWECPECGKQFIRDYRFDKGEVSDGYHTFNELYHHRTMLFATVCNEFSNLAWKSRQHHDPQEKMYSGMFIVGINTPKGQATYHCDVDPYWDLFKVKELERAPEWDGHTSNEAIERIYSLSEYNTIKEKK